MTTKKLTRKRIAELKEILDKHGAVLTKFVYYKKYFGDFEIEIENNGAVHSFLTDKGEVVHNGQPIRHGPYHIAGQDDTFPFLLKIIKKELFNEL